MPELAPGFGIAFEKEASQDLLRISVDLDIAALAEAGQIYPDTATALAALAEGDYFWVENADGDLQLYREESGVAVAQDYIMPNAAVVEASRIAHQRFTGPFLEDVSDTYMRGLVEDIRIEGGDAGHDYILNYETLNLGGGDGRVRFTVRDATLGINVCTWSLIDTQANVVARTTPTVFLHQDDLASYTGITATAWINWDAITSWAVGLTTYTTVAQSGIRPENVYTPDDIDQFRHRAEPKILLTVGAGTETGTHFNTRAAAVASLYIPGVTVTRSTYPISNICTFSNQVLIEDVDDGLDEQVTLVDIGGVDQSPIVLPPYVTLRGRGPSSRLYADDATNGGPVIEAPFPFRIENMTVENVQEGYSVHIDNSNAIAKRATTGPAVLRYRMISVMQQATLKCGAAATSWNIGCGISNGQLIKLDRCRVINAANQPALGIHTSPSTTDAGEIEVIDSYFNDATIGTAIQLLKSHAMTVQHRVNVKGSDLDDITVGNTAGGSSGFIREGKIDPSITIGGTLDT